MSDLGLIHIYCGHGKGKTTAAFGLALRALGHGNRVLVVQFLKGRETGELMALDQCERIKVLRGKMSRKFTFQMDEAEKAALTENHNRLLQEAIDDCCNFDLLILDEVLDAYDGFLAKALLSQFLGEKPSQLEVVLTGRKAAPEIEELAHYITSFTPVRHPFEQGVKAREGIEF